MDERVFGRLKKKVANWLLEHSEDAVTRQMSHDDPTEFFNELAAIDSKDSLVSISMGFEDLSHWHLVQYENALLNQNQLDPAHLGHAAKYAKAMIDFNAAFIHRALARCINCGVLPDVAALTLSLSIIAGWKAEAQSVLNTLVAGLDSSLLDLRKSPLHSAGELYRHFWFLLHLGSDLFSTNVTPSNYSYPDDMSPYAEVLAQWKTDDLSTVQRLVSSMADFHLTQSRSTGHADILEFDVESRALFPYEILAFLRIREWVGVKNPDAYDHPLMNTPLARLPEKPAVYSGPDFYEKVTGKLAGMQLTKIINSV